MHGEQKILNGEEKKTLNKKTGKNTNHKNGNSVVISFFLRFNKKLFSSRNIFFLWLPITDIFILNFSFPIAAFLL